MKTIKPLTNENRLTKHVRCWLNAKGRDYDEGAAGAYRDLMYGGCASGIVNHLIYTRDCEAFAKRYLAEILEVIDDLAESMGEPAWPDERRGQSLSVDWLAWVGFEETARRIAVHVGIED